MRIHLIFLSAAAFALGSSGTSAQTVVVKSNPWPSEKVSFADLNLDTTAGRATLDRRIRGAARRVCVIDADRSLENFSAGKLCYAAAVVDGHRQMTDVIAGRQFGSGIATATLTIRGQ